ncbi:Ig-like domain-containing protein, partial [Neobacillus drentensis]|uniref:Ig-like domain-containing protein n=1 Tax=Neobacillus drentensis TaxID=220684 RepID=UPI00300179F7
MRKFVALLIIFLLTFSITLTGQKKVSAETTTNETEGNGTLSTANLLDLKSDPVAEVIGTIDGAYDEDYYRFDLASPGKVKIDLSVNQITRHKVSLLSSNGTIIESWNTKFMDSNDLVTMIDIGLAPGTYYVKISFFSNTELVNKPYTLKVGYTESSTSEQEINNTVDTANNISLNTPIMATISGYHDDDFYQINIPKDTTLTLLTTRAASTYSVKFFSLDSSVNQSVNTEEGDTITLTNLMDVKVKAGTYYIQVKPLSIGSIRFDRYTLQLIEKDIIPPAAPKVNHPLTDQSTTLSGTAEPYSIIYLKANDKYNDYKYYLGTVDKNGSFKFSIGKLRGGTYVNITAKDRTGNESQATTIKVKDVTPPGAPFVNQLTSKSTYVTGKTEAYAKLYIKKGSKTLASGKADAQGKFKIKITQQKQKTNLYVYAIDSSGNKSKTTTVKVKDITPPSAPSVSKVTTSSRYITGKTEPYAKIQVKRGCQCIASGKADSHGKFKIKISKQKRKAKLYVYATDSSGNKS